MAILLLDYGQTAIITAVAQVAGMPPVGVSDALSLRAQRSNLLLRTAMEIAAHAHGLDPRVASLLTRIRAAVSFSVIPAKAGTQGERT
jgi:hypothetical protein